MRDLRDVVLVRCRARKERTNEQRAREAPGTFLDARLGEGERDRKNFPTQIHQSAIFLRETKQETDDDDDALSCSIFASCNLTTTVRAVRPAVDAVLFTQHRFTFRLGRIDAARQSSEKEEDKRTNKVAFGGIVLIIIIVARGGCIRDFEREQRDDFDLPTALFFFFSSGSKNSFFFFFFFCFWWGFVCASSSKVFFF